METEIKKKKTWEKLCDLLGKFFAFLIFCLVLVLICVLIYTTIEVMFENPVSLGIICGTIIILVLIWDK